jgi:hypothetical protein
MSERGSSGSAVEVLVTEHCDPCRQCLALWQSLCRELGIPCTPVDISTPVGTRLGRSARLSTLPAVFIRGELVAVGVQSRHQALALLVATGCLDNHRGPQ